MIPKELQEAIKCKYPVNSYIEMVIQNAALDGARLALEYMGDRWVNIDKKPPVYEYVIFKTRMDGDMFLGFVSPYGDYMCGCQGRYAYKWSHADDYICEYFPLYKFLPQPPKTTNDEK